MLNSFSLEENPYHFSQVARAFGIYYLRTKISKDDVDPHPRLSKEKLENFQRKIFVLYVQINWNKEQKTINVGKTVDKNIDI